MAEYGRPGGIKRLGGIGRPGGINRLGGIGRPGGINRLDEIGRFARTAAAPVQII